MTVIQHNVGIVRPQALYRSSNSGMVGIKERAATHSDLGCIGQQASSVQRLAVERRGRTRLRCGLSRVERSARWIAIAIDDRARDGGANDRCAEGRCKVVEAID